MENYTIEYDEKLQEGLKHLQNYPQMLPFIGKFWKDSKTRILILGESHYIPGEELDEAHLQDWYENNSDNFYKELADYIDTRRVVNRADNKKIKFDKPLTMYYNIIKECKENIPALLNEEHIFPFFSYYNYFQRPAFIQTESIINAKIDDEIAYKTLKLITSLIKPKQIIIASRKAMKSFNQQQNIDSEKLFFENFTIDSVPHASSAWWNRKSKSYGNQTGRGKFISLISNDLYN
jgi:hypothetical protein